MTRCQVQLLPREAPSAAGWWLHSKPAGVRCLHKPVCLSFWSPPVLGSPALLSPEPSQATRPVREHRWVPAEGALPKGPGQGSGGRAPVWDCLSRGAAPEPMAGSWPHLWQ